MRLGSRGAGGGRGGGGGGGGSSTHPWTAVGPYTSIVLLPQDYYTRSVKLK